MKLTDIPPDIRNTVELMLCVIRTKLQQHACPTCGCLSDDELVECISEAIIYERLQCAKIADVFNHDGTIGRAIRAIRSPE